MKNFQEWRDQQIQLLSAHRAVFQLDIRHSALKTAHAALAKIARFAPDSLRADIDYLKQASVTSKRSFHNSADYADWLTRARVRADNAFETAIAWLVSLTEIPNRPRQSRQVLIHGMNPAEFILSPQFGAVFNGEIQLSDNEQRALWRALQAALKPVPKPRKRKSE